MNPAKSSLFIFLIITGIYILSILASPSAVPHQKEPFSTTESPAAVDDEARPKSDQLTIFKRNVPAALPQQQGGSSSTPQAPPAAGPSSDQLTRRKRHQQFGGVRAAPLRRQGVSSTTIQAPTGPPASADDQLTIFKRNVPAAVAAVDQEEGSSTTTEQTFPSDQWGLMDCPGSCHGMSCEICD